MPVTLIWEANASDANSYVSLEEFNLFLESHLHGSIALSKSDDLKKSSLIVATRLINTIEYEGIPTELDQALAYGREGLEFNGIYIDGETIPRQIKDATMEYARLLLLSKTDLTSSSAIEVLGLSKLKASTLELSFRDTSKRIGDNGGINIPSSVLALIPKGWIKQEEYEAEIIAI